MPVVEDLLVAQERLQIDAIIRLVTDLAAVLRGAERALLGAAAGGDQAALRVAGAFGDDVDDAVDGVRAPQRPARPAHHLDAVDVLHQHVLHVPEHTGKQRCIDTAAVNHHQQVARKNAVEAPG